MTRLVGSPEAVASHYGANPPTYFWQALVCMFLFLPTGVAAVAYSILVSRKSQAGDYSGSARASYLTRLWCLASLVVFLVALVVTAFTGFKG